VGGMDNQALYFAVKTISMSHCNGRKPCDLLTAARHNLREIQCKLGASGHIDARRMADNVVLEGPGTAAEVQALADKLLQDVDKSKLKRDHVQAIEAVFSLPTGSPVEPLAYFGHCLTWLKKTLPLPVLLAVAHRDETTPHMHAILLPVASGKHIGGLLVDRAKLLKLRESFFQKVAGPNGLHRQGAKVRGETKRLAVEAVLSVCEAEGLPNANGPLWGLFRAEIERDPTQYMLALGIDPNTLRRSPIALAASPIALQKHQGLSCVALAQPTTPQTTKNSTPAPAPPERAIESLDELWAAVGHRAIAVSNPRSALVAQPRIAPRFAEWKHNGHSPKWERLKHARAAMQAAITKHQPTQPGKRRVGPLTPPPLR
jgi:hypothetical protein